MQVNVSDGASSPFRYGGTAAPSGPPQQEKPMTRSGKEPAEDVKRAFRRAIKLAGLKAHRVEMFKTEGSGGRIVMGSANPEGWLVVMITVLAAKRILARPSAFWRARPIIAGERSTWVTSKPRRASATENMPVSPPTSRIVFTPSSRLSISRHRRAQLTASSAESCSSFAAFASHHCRSLSSFISITSPVSFCSAIGHCARRQSVIRRLLSTVNLLPSKSPKSSINVNPMPPSSDFSSCK